MIALAVALVGAGILASTAVYSATNHRVPVLVAEANVPAGALITASDVGTASVSVGAGVQVIPASQMSQVVGQVAGTTLHPGMLLTAAELATQRPPDPGQVLVPLPVRPSALPASGLQPGDQVLVVATPGAQGQAGSASAAPATERAGRRGGRGGQHDGQHRRVRRGGRPGAGQERRGSGRAGLDRPVRAHRDEAEPGVSLYALVSPGGSPGCTTTALAVTLTWPQPVILAECDPAGGDILAGLFAGHLPGAARAARRGVRGGPWHGGDVGRGQRAACRP